MWEAAAECSNLREPRDVRGSQSERAQQCVPREAKFSSSVWLEGSVGGKAEGGTTGMGGGAHSRLHGVRVLYRKGLRDALRLRVLETEIQRREEISESLQPQPFLLLLYPTACLA